MTNSIAVLLLFPEFASWPLPHLGQISVFAVIVEPQCLQNILAPGSMRFPPEK
jgi:hypothetical protein